MRTNILSLLIALQDQLDCDDIIKLLIKYNRAGCIFLLIEDSHMKEANKHQFLLEVFRYSMQREQLTIAIRLMFMYEKILIKEAQILNEIIVTSFARSPFFFEIKLFILDKFLKTMDYQQCDRLIEAIESHFLGDTADGILANNINPILTSLLLLEFLLRLKNAYNVFEFRVEQLSDVLNS